MAIVRIDNVRPTSDGSGAILASAEALLDDGTPVGLRSEVRLSAEQTQQLIAAYQESDAAGAALAGQMAAQIDARFAPPAVLAYIAGNSTAAQLTEIVSGRLPLDVPVAVQEPTPTPQEPTPQEPTP